MKKLIFLSILATVLLSGCMHANKMHSHEEMDQRNPAKEICDACGRSLRGIDAVGN